MSASSASRKAAGWLAIVFLLGAGFGSVLGYEFSRRGSASAAAPDTDTARREHMVERFDQELHLTTAQRASLEQILTGLQGQYRSIRHQIDTPINGAREQGRAQIRAILTPEQKPKFEEFLKRLDEERKRRNQ
jgi:Spy/CpxP family protein refolding chaperone